ncbi:MAG: DHA2 family efflux MFS transporter permease subunit [Thermincola sp.]|jgi:EmrB/QacA subfamily drug resistance transporter|nr:DHA2 family efflux MFS transporter permease subunit [Thermincola sp.]MDT3704491.1 DHA2 family efflux MFS transporter permease subunit [Thermincola sp.]
MENRRQDSLYKWLALGVVVIGTFMAILDTSIVNIAIPKMMNVFGVSTDEIKWVLTAYMLTMGAVIPLTGYLGDRFGTKKVYIWALISFTAGSALCGFAWSNSAMIAARIIQAIGGGMIMPVSMSILYQVVPQEERGMALGIWGIAAMAAPAIGPTLSGYIVEHLDWRLIFTINIPVGVIGVILTGIILEEFPKRPTKGFDYLGFLSCTAGLGCILYVLGEGSAIDWSQFSNVFLILIGVFSLILFVANELTHEDPLLDLRLLKIWPFTLSILISGAINIAMFGGIFLLPLYLQNLQGYSAMQTGVLLFPSAVATGITMPIGGRLFDKVGAKPVVIPGLILMTLSTYFLSEISLETSPNVIILLTVVRGIGMGLAMMPSSTQGMNAIPRHLVGRASALSNVIRQVAGSLGITILTTVMQNNQVENYVRLSDQISWFNPNSLQLVQSIQGWLARSGISPSESQGAAIGTIYGMVQRNSFLNAIDHTFLITTFIALATVMMAFLMQGKDRDKASGEQGPVILD